MRGLSLVAASGGHSSSRCAGLSLSRPLVAEHRLQTRRLSSCGSRAQPLRGMWDLPRPGLKPVCPALAGRFSTTAPPGKPREAPKCLNFLKRYLPQTFRKHYEQNVACNPNNFWKKLSTLEATIQRCTGFQEKTQIVIYT